MRVQRLRATAIPYLYFIRADQQTKLSGSAGPIGLEARIDVPELAFLRGTVFHRGAPFPAEANFIQPVPQGENGHERRNRSQHGRPRLVRKKRSDDAENIRGDPAVAAMLSRDAAPAGA